MSAPRFKINIIANLAGRMSSMVLSFLFTPVYIHLLGIEAYGLIGFYITLQATISFLEMGLSRACNRELARYSGVGQSACQSIYDTVRSLEVVYWLVALLIGCVLTFISSWVGSTWIESSEFSVPELSHIVILIAWVIALRWPIGLYNGALMGMQQQVLMNSLLILTAVLNWVGSAILLWLVDSSILLFFEWQLVVSVLSVVLVRLVAWRKLPGEDRHGRFSSLILKNILPFVAGVGGNAVLGTILRQADKIILSALLPLKQFGYYMLATVIANAASILATAVSNALFPRLSQMIGAQESTEKISSLYHLCCQAVNTVIIPVSLVVAFFSYDVLQLYTGNEEIAQNTSTVLMILVIAKMLHSNMIIPYSLQLAYGWVRLSVYVNILSVIWFVPAVYILAEKYGMVGAAVSWLIVTIGYVIIVMPVMHKRILPGEWMRWMWRDFLGLMLPVVLFLGIVKEFMGESITDSLSKILMLVIISVIALLAAYAFSPDVRQNLRRKY